MPAISPVGGGKTGMNVFWSFSLPVIWWLLSLFMAFDKYLENQLYPVIHDVNSKTLILTV